MAHRYYDGSKWACDWVFCQNIQTATDLEKELLARLKYWLDEVEWLRMQLNELRASLRTLKQQNAYLQQENKRLCDALARCVET